MYRLAFKVALALTINLLSTSLLMATKEPILDVGIMLNKKEVVVTSTGGIRIRRGVQGPTVDRVYSSRKATFTRLGDEVIGPDGRRAPAFRLEAIVRGRYMTVGGHSYRGFFVIAPAMKGPGVNLINHIDLESYLKGVLKAEMLPTFHPEALKAQAVVSRTYAMRHRDTFRHLGFGLKATEQSQVYKGLEGEDVRTTAAVMATRGIVLTHNGEFIEASYCSSCGGRTEANENVWEGRPKPYTRSVKCDWCADCPNFEWRAELSYEAIEKALNGHGWPLGAIKAIDLSYSESGRVRYVVVTTVEGRQVYIPGNKFRIIVDRRKLKSLKFVFKDDPVGELLAMNPDMEPKNDEAEAAIQSIINGYLKRYVTTRRRLQVVGRGFGHGVGLCQWGAQGYAKRNASFRQILRHYYQETRLKKIY